MFDVEKYHLRYLANCKHNYQKCGITQIVKAMATMSDRKLVEYSDSQMIKSLTRKLFNDVEERKKQLTETIISEKGIDLDKLNELNFFDIFVDQIDGTIHPREEGGVNYFNHNLYIERIYQLELNKGVTLNTFQKKDLPKPNVIDVYCDGACRGNPGESGTGIYIKGIVEFGRYTGFGTNNEAEYKSLIDALEYLCQTGRPHARVKVVESSHTVRITIHMDSKLCVEQMKGNYKVKSPNIKPLYKKAVEFVKRLSKTCSITFKHIPRAENSIADSLANKSVDLKDAHIKELK
jgi:ribonuclease HI